MTSILGNTLAAAKADALTKRITRLSAQRDAIRSPKDRRHVDRMANALHAQGADFAHSDNDATWLAQIEQRLSQKTPWAKWQADLIKRAQDIISHGRLESGKLLALVRLVDKGENSPLTKGEINRLEALISAAH